MADNPFLDEPRFEKILRFSDGRGYMVEVAPNGTVLVPKGQDATFKQKIMKSTDGGDIWTAIDIDAPRALIVVDHINNHILLLGLSYRSEKHLNDPVEVGNAGAGFWFPLFRSADNGKSWQYERAVIHKDKNGYLPSSGGAENGITLQYGPNSGRLVVPARVFVGYERTPKNEEHYNMAIYSDDGGKTWYCSEPFPEKGTGEGALAELPDGRIYYNSRSHIADDARRRHAWSYDGGQTWQDLEISFLPDNSGRANRAYGCKGGLIRLPLDNEDILIYSNLDISPDETRRSRIAVWASFDGGLTWPVKRLVYEGPSGYSMLAAGLPGTPSEGWIYLGFEGGPRGDTTDVVYQGARDQNFARFNLSWILEGKITGDGVIPADVDIDPIAQKHHTGMVDN